MSTYPVDVQAVQTINFATGTVFAGPARLLGLYFKVADTSSRILLNSKRWCVQFGTSKAVFDTILMDPLLDQEILIKLKFQVMELDSKQI